MSADRLADRPSKRYSQHRFAAEIAPLYALAGHSVTVRLRIPGGTRR
jgi:hypothetical protein